MKRWKIEEVRGRYTLETATAALVKAREEGFSELSLQGGEPTIFPDLVPLVAEARRLGFEFIGMVTNGRKLKDPDYTRALLEAGLDGISASLLGPDAETHDALSAAPGAFDALVEGLRNASEIAAQLSRTVKVNANMITSARSVDTIAEQVRLLSTLGVQTGALHLVRFTGLASDPGVVGPLRFDIRRLPEALTRAFAEADRAGFRLHATDVPLCLHGRLDVREVELLLQRSRVSRHHFEAAAYRYDVTTHGHAAPDVCRSCMLRNACPLVPPEYLPEDPAKALRPLTSASVAAEVERVLGALDPAEPGSAVRLFDLERSMTTLEQIAGAPGLLEASRARLREALGDLMRLAAMREDIAEMSAAFAALLGLYPRTRSEDRWGHWPLLRLPLTELSERARVVPEARAPGSSCLRFGERFALALDGTVEEDGEVSLRGVVPIAEPTGATAINRLTRALFLLLVAQPLASAKRLRVTPETFAADFGSGMRTLWAIAKDGAIVLESPARDVSRAVTAS